MVKNKEFSIAVFKQKNPKSVFLTCEYLASKMLLLNKFMIMNVKNMIIVKLEYYLKEKIGIFLNCRSINSYIVCIRISLLLFGLDCLSSYHHYQSFEKNIKFFYLINTYWKNFLLLYFSPRKMYTLCIFKYLISYSVII